MTKKTANTARNAQPAPPAQAQTAMPANAGAPVAQPQPGQIQIDPQYIMKSLQQQRDEANNRAVMSSAHAEQLAAEVERLQTVIAQQATELSELKGTNETKQ